MVLNVSFPVIDFSDFDNRYAFIAEKVLEASKSIGFFFTLLTIMVLLQFNLSKLL
ncbi:hypothetical protein BDA99DRAFT_527339, partial [Phascolomyces articulosus]